MSSLRRRRGSSSATRTRSLLAAAAPPSRLEVKVLRRGLFIALMGLAACVTGRPDSMGGSDSRLDDGAKGDRDVARAEEKGECGPDAKGDIVLLDSRTGGPLTCALVTVSMEPDSCPNETTCPSEMLFQGHTNRRGQFVVTKPFSRMRLEATVDGYGT